MFGKLVLAGSALASFVVVGLLLVAGHAALASLLTGAELVVAVATRPWAQERAEDDQPPAGDGNKPGQLSTRAGLVISGWAALACAVVVWLVAGPLRGGLGVVYVAAGVTVFTVMGLLTLVAKRRGW